MRKKYEPIREIQFAAKSGFITKELWNRFFAYGCLAWQYRLWSQIVSDRVFIPHRSKNVSEIWILNRSNLLVRKTVGLSISNPPFVSQIGHDELVSQFVLEIMKQGIGLRYRLEPELKKMAPGIKRHYETAIKEKYPDGLIQVANEDKTRIALELELTAKEPKRYRQILDTYSSYEKADLVVFIVRDDRLMRTIKQAVRDSHYPNLEKPIGFGRLDDWVKNPIEAKLFFSESVTTLADLKNKNEKIAA